LQFQYVHIYIFNDAAIVCAAIANYVYLCKYSSFPELLYRKISINIQYNKFFIHFIDKYMLESFQ